MKIIPLKRLTGSLMTLLLILPLVSFTIKPELPAYRIQTIVIDPGHGGKFPGTSGKFSREQDVTLKVGLLLGKLIQDNMPGVKVIYTRMSDTQLSDNRSADLVERVNIANRAKADLLIAIHCNSTAEERYISGYTKNSKGKSVPVYRYRKNTSVKGAETFVAGFDRLGEQDKALRQYALEEDFKTEEKAGPADPASAIMLSLMKYAYRDQSIRFGEILQDEYAAAGRVNLGVKEQSLAVLRTATMPAVLTEIGFLSNPQEEEYLNSEAGQNEIATCLLNAIQAYKKIVEM